MRFIFGALVTAALVGAALGAQPLVARAQTTATPASGSTVTPAPTATGSTSSGTGSDPSLSVMNANGNHSMGSTVRAFDSGSTSSTTTQPKTGTMAAPMTSSVPPGVPGMDVSSYQTTTAATWKTVYAQGGRFVYVKATESTNYASDTFYEQYTDSYNAGLIHGAYHFAHPNSSSGATQANFFVNNGGGWSNDGRTLPPLLDIEYNPSGATCYGLSQAAMVSWIADFSNTVKSRTGRLPAIYSTTGWWTQCTGNTSKFSANPLFIARYPINVSDGPGTLPAGWSKYTFWQWADSGIFPGDQDVFNGSLTQLQSFARGTTVTDPSPVNPMRVPIFGAGDLNGDGKPDFLARRPDGTLWFYAGTGAVNSTDEGYQSAVKIGWGWNVYDEILGVGDFNGDGKPDLVARKPDGTLWFYPGTGTTSATSSGLGAGVKIGNGGWNAYQEVVAAGDLNGDGKPDLLARKPDGTLWFYAGTGVVNATNDGYLAAVKVGNSGWNAYLQVLGVGDLNHDGHSDLVAMRTDGTLWFYAGTGSISGTSDGYQAARPISAPGLAASDTLAAVGDLNADGYPDLLARSSTGTLKFLGGSSFLQEGYGSAIKIGNGGWSAYTSVIGVGDFDGDGLADLVAVRNDGTLWFYKGTGTAGTTQGYQPAVKIGNGGWGAYTTVVATGDLNGDGKRDLVALRSDGTLWFYAGTGTIGSTSDGYAAAVRIGSGWGAYTRLIGVGDLSRDGKPDLLGIRSDGSAWLFAGTGHTTATSPYFAAPVAIAGADFSGYTAVVGTGDLNGDHVPDLIARKSDGTLWFFAGRSGTTPGFAAPIKIGTGGWNVYASIVGTGDFNHDGHADFVAVRTDGTLWFYAGYGTTGMPAPIFSSAISIGSGWGIYG
jgi:Lyzozyme M1 (1,4-beta-N-acetylmuramidase)